MRGILLAGALLLGTAPAPGQSLLERSPNVHGVWTLERGTAAFVFAHRFEFLSGGDELFNIPTLTLAVGLPLGITAGLDYTSYSEVVAARLTGNETQYWLKRAFGVTRGLDAAGMVAYNSAARSWDAAADLRAEAGRFGVFGELRGFSDRFGRGDPGMAGAAGAMLQMTPYLGVTGDIGRVLDEDSVPSVWSAALAMAIPGTPHTLSLQATNGGAITLQGASREKVVGRPGKLRYGFVFTVPLGTGDRWLRIFRPSPPPPLRAGGMGDSVTARVQMKMVAFAPAEIRIRTGQRVEWVNLDPIEHTVTADDGSWGSELLQEGERYARRFVRPGRYAYHCTPHPQMRGVVIVEDGQTDTTP